MLRKCFATLQVYGHVLPGKQGAAAGLLSPRRPGSLTNCGYCDRSTRSPHRIRGFVAESQMQSSEYGYTSVTRT